MSSTLTTRAQAFTEARELLGAGALLHDVIDVAHFLLDTYPETPPSLLTPAECQPGASLTFVDGDGDEALIYRALDPTPEWAGCIGDAEVSAADVVRAIEFLELMRDAARAPQPPTAPAAIVGVAA